MNKKVKTRFKKKMSNKPSTYTKKCGTHTKKRSYLKYKSKGGTIEEELPLPQDINKENSAKNIIQNFMIKNKYKIKAIFLKSICTDSGVCIAFGKESNNIKKFFDYFQNPNFVQLPIRKIGHTSINGFINEVKYDREGYNAFTILKSCTHKKVDNLYYEYLVGQYINKVALVFPCFVETYNIYKYNTEKDWQEVRDNNSSTIMHNIFTNQLTLLPNINLAESCLYSQFLAISIQHINNAKTLYEKLLNSYDKTFKYDLLYILYQIYMPLAVLSNNFTHYDLHANNILIYEPFKGKYIEYFYHPKDIENVEITSFKSRYITKIIDYGKAYFKDNNVSSLNIYNEICTIKECGGSACGYDYGYKSLLPERYEGSTSYITSYKGNKSHDLRLLNSLKYSNYPFFPELREMLNHITYEMIHGTKERININPVTLTLHQDIINLDTINNVEDALTGLEYIVQMPKYKKLNDEKYSNLQKMGDLHIYEDGTPMEYIPV